MKKVLALLLAIGMILSGGIHFSVTADADDDDYVQFGDVLPRP